jgi:hypothetical protein
MLESLESRDLMAADPLPVLMVLADHHDFCYRDSERAGDLAAPKAEPADYSAIAFVGGWGSSMYQHAHSSVDLARKTDTSSPLIAKAIVRNEVIEAESRLPTEGRDLLLGEAGADHLDAGLSWRADELAVQELMAEWDGLGGLVTYTATLGSVPVSGVRMALHEVIGPGCAVNCLDLLAGDEGRDA